jgi:hypothetical protein
MSREHTGLKTSDTASARLLQDGRDDEPLTIGGKLELRLGRDPEQLEDRLVDDDAGTVAARCLDANCARAGATNATSAIDSSD